MPREVECCSQGSSLRNAASFIVLIDLAIVAIPLTFETATLGYFLGLLEPFDEIFKIKEECFRGNCSWIVIEHHEKLASFQLTTYSVGLLIMFILMGAVIEGYLFAMIRRGVREKIHHWCKRWLIIRSFFLVIVIFGSVGKILRNHYSIWIDGMFDLIKVYRVIALIIVGCYMTEIERTVGVIYIQPPRRVKKGSLGQDIHLLD